MSEAEEQKIFQLEKELLAAQELLFLVLDKIGKPVAINVEEAKKRMNGNRIIDLELDEAQHAWVLQVVDIDNG